jgi:hypothetical protein
MIPTTVIRWVSLGVAAHNTVQLVLLKPIEDYVSGERLDICDGKEWRLHTFIRYEVATYNSDCFGMRARATKLAPRNPL